MLPSGTTKETPVGASATESHRPFSDMQQRGVTNSNLSTYPAETSSETLGLHSSLTPTAYASFPAMEQGYGSMPGSDARTHPTNTLGETNFSSSSATVPPDDELHHDISGIQQGHEGMVSINLRTDYVAVIGEADCSNPHKKLGSELQNPPVQVMERPGDPAFDSSYRIPSHVFDRANANTPVEWSTCSNESLFSIHTGTMSFSKEINWLGKSGELDKFGDMSLSSPVNSFPSNQPPGNKFNDMSQRTAEQDQSSGVTEAKAAETMREVIRETTEKNTEEDLSTRAETSHSNVLSKSSNQSAHSDGSTKSFAFQALTGDGEKSASSRDSEEKPKQQNHSGPQTPKETTNAAQVPNPTTNACNSRWLSCFSCCPFCH